jgi:hypothetical protein
VIGGGLVTFTNWWVLAVRNLLTCLPVNQPNQPSSRDKASDYGSEGWGASPSKYTRGIASWPIRRGTRQESHLDWLFKIGKKLQDYFSTCLICMNQHEQIDDCHAP